MVKKKIIRYNIRLVNRGIQIFEEEAFKDVVDIWNAIEDYRGRIICQFASVQTKPPSNRFLYMYFMVEPPTNNDVYVHNECVIVRFPMDEMDTFIDVLRNETIVDAIFDDLVEPKMVGIESRWQKKKWIKKWICRIFP